MQKGGTKLPTTRRDSTPAGKRRRIARAVTTTHPPNFSPIKDQIRVADM
jgi:hypothetical protein